MSEKIQDKDLEENEKQVAEDPKYRVEGEIIKEAFQCHPNNTERAIVAMKVSLIDLTNSTNLSRNLGRSGGLDELVSKILEIDFDERVSCGDLSIVGELAKFTKEKFGKNLFSFFSKYCFYHNVHCYNRDDFVIYDSIISKNLGKYIVAEEYRELTSQKLNKNSFEKLRETYDYEKYVSVMDHIIEKNGFLVDKPRRKLEQFIWYKHHPKND